MYGYIYKITNTVNDKIYIGKKKSKVFLGNKYLGSGVLIRQIVEQYGDENFTVQLLEKCDSKEELRLQELYWIIYFRSTLPEIGYNIYGTKQFNDYVNNLKHPNISFDKLFKKYLSYLNTVKDKQKYVELKEKLRTKILHDKLLWLKSETDIQFVLKFKTVVPLHKNGICKSFPKNKLQQKILNEGWQLGFLD